jgi:polar amino acid transport system substrate-binding protein
LAIAGVALFGTVAAQAQDKSRLDEILARGHVIVGVTSEAPPFGFIDAKGDLVGFDIDVAKLVARSLFGGQEKIELVKQGFAARWPNVQSGRVDFGIQVTTIFPDRVLNVAFTRAYIDSGVVVITRANSGLKTLADVNSEKVTLGNLTAPVQAERAKKFFPKAKAVTFDAISSQLTAVKTGRADAAMLDVPVALWYAKENPDMRVIDEWMTAPTNNAIFLKHGDFKLWHVLDTIVSEMRAGSLLTEYAEIHRKWFGVEPPDLKPYLKK